MHARGWLCFARSGLALKSHLERSRGDEKGVVNLRPSLTLSLEQVSYDLRFGGVPKMGRYSKNINQIKFHEQSFT